MPARKEKNMLKTHNKYRSLSLLLTLGVVVGQLFPVLADDELPTVETIPETEEFDSSGNLGTDDNNGFGEDFGDENPDNDGFGLGSDDQEPPEVPVTTPEPSAPPVYNSGVNPEPPAATEPGENDPTEPVTDPSEQQPQPVTLTGNAEDGKIKVETTTTTTVLPADAFIQADLIKDEQRMAILDGLKDSKYSIDGILPIDIFFLVKNPESDTADPIPLPEESTVDLKFSINKDLIHSDKDIDWNSVEVVKVTTNDEGKYEKKTLIENKDLKLVELPVESEPVAPDTDEDQNNEPTEDTDTDSDPVQKSTPAQTTESGTVTKETVPENQDPAKPSASSNAERTAAPETTEETTEFEQVEDADKVDPADVNAAHPDKSPAEPSQAYQGTVTLDGATQIALTWKNKKSSIIDEIKDSIGNTFGTLTEGIKDIFDKLENADLDLSFMDSSSNKNDQDNYGSDYDSFVAPDLKIDKADTKKPDTVSSEPSTQGTDEEPAKESDKVPFEKSIEGITVKATAAKGVLPEDAEMRVSMITDEQSAAYTNAIEALDSSDAEYDGVQVIDISFWDKNETEIEPKDGSVDIQMSFAKDLIDKNTEAGSIEIHHIDESQGVKAAERVAVEPTNISEKTDSNEYEAEFPVSSFSSFVITWKKNDSTKMTITVHRVDTQGREIAGSNQNIDVKDEDNITLSNYGSLSASSIYDYKYAEYRSNDGAKKVNTINLKKQTRSEKYYAVLSPGKEHVYPTDNQPLALDLYFIYEKKAGVENDWEVNFDVNGGSRLTSSPMQVTGKYGSSITLPMYEEGIREGYTFVGWATTHNTQSRDEKLTKTPGSTYIPRNGETITFYAVWQPDEDIMQPHEKVARFFIQKEGKIPQEPSNYAADQYSEEMRVVDTITKSRWVVDVSAEQLIAPQVQGYLKINGDNGEIITDESNANFYYIADNLVSQGLKKFPTLDQIKASRIDFNPSGQFIYWYVQKWQGNTENNYQYESEGWHIDGVILDLTLLTVTYDRNCDDASVLVPTGYQVRENTTITVGSEKGHSTVSPPVREGYTFKGWALKRNPEAGDQIYSSDSITPDEYKVMKNITFYAQWEINTTVLSVTKLITGNAADLTEKFQFNVVIKDKNGEFYRLANSDSVNVKIENEKYVFNLANNETVTFVVPENGSCEIKEVDSKDYQVSNTVNNEDRKETAEREINSINSTQHVVYTNKKQIQIPTGLGDGNNHSLMILFGAGLAAMLGLLAAKAYRRMNGI